VARYETFAGRGAMLGFATAAVVEISTDQGVFFASGLTADAAALYAAVAGGTLLAAAGAAVLKNAGSQASSDEGAELLPAVWASLTAVKRSASCATEVQVRAASARASIRRRKENLDEQQPQARSEPTRPLCVVRAALLQVDSAVDALCETVLDTRFDYMSIEGLLSITDDEP
jgi:hypothetical protein